MADKRRWAFIPLEFTTYEETKLKALEGEFAVNRATGDVYIKKDGELVCSTENLKEKVEDIIQSGINFVAMSYNNNKKIFRLFFDSGIARLDKDYVFDSCIKYFRIRDISDPAMLYTTLTSINLDVVLINPVLNNETYFLELFNENRELVSQQLISAKYAPRILASEDNKIISRIEIVTERNFLYKDESIEELLYKVYEIFEDNSSRDITYSNKLVVDTSNVNMKVAGNYPITAIYYYDTLNGLHITTDCEIRIIDEAFNEVIDMEVIPYKIVTLSDGTKSIKIKVIAYYKNGIVKDVTSTTVIEGFNETLFNVNQSITVRLNLGIVSIFTKDFQIFVRDSGAASNYTLKITDNIMRIDSVSNLDPVFTYFKVRSCVDIELYYTLGFNTIGYDAFYIDPSSFTDKLHTGSNVLIEFYDKDKNFIEAEVFSCEYFLQD